MRTEKAAVTPLRQVPWRHNYHNQSGSVSAHVEAAAPKSALCSDQHSQMLAISRRHCWPMLVEFGLGLAKISQTWPTIAPSRPILVRCVYGAEAVGRKSDDRSSGGKGGPMHHTKMPARWMENPSRKRGLGATQRGIPACPVKGSPKVTTRPAEPRAETDRNTARGVRSNSKSVVLGVQPYEACTPHNQTQVGRTSGLLKYWPNFGNKVAHIGQTRWRLDRIPAPGAISGWGHFGAGRIPGGGVALRNMARAGCPAGRLCDNRSRGAVSS